MFVESNFLKKERIEQDLKEDFGSGWKDLDNDVKEQLIAGRERRLLKKYKKFGSMGEEVGRIRRDQSQMYIGIMLGLSGGLIGEVVDRWFGGNIFYDSAVVIAFVGLVATVHYAFDSLVKEIFNFTTNYKNKKSNRSKITKV